MLASAGVPFGWGARHLEGEAGGQAQEDERSDQRGPEHELGERAPTCRREEASDHDAGRHTDERVHPAHAEGQQPVPHCGIEAQHHGRATIAGALAGACSPEPGAAAPRRQRVAPGEPCGQRGLQKADPHGIETLHDQIDGESEHEAVDRGPNAAALDRMPPDPTVSPAEGDEHGEGAEPELDPHVGNNPGRGAMRPLPAKGRVEGCAPGAQVHLHVGHPQNGGCVPVLRGPEEAGDRLDEEHDQVTAAPPIFAAVVGVEDGAGAVNELVAGAGLAGHQVGVEVEIGAEIDLAAVVDQEQHQAAEQEAAAEDGDQARAAAAQQVPADDQDGGRHEGRPAPGAEQAMDQQGADEEDHPGPVDGGQPAAGARREQEQEGHDGEELQVADRAAVGPDAAIGATVGGVEAADVAEHVGVGGKADAAQDAGPPGRGAGRRRAAGRPAGRGARRRPARCRAGCRRRGRSVPIRLRVWT